MTKKSSMLEAIRSAAEPIIQALDMELVDVEYAKEAPIGVFLCLLTGRKACR